MTPPETLVLDAARLITEREAERARLLADNTKLQHERDAYLAHLESSQAELARLRDELAETKRLLAAACVGELSVAIRP